MKRPTSPASIKYGALVGDIVVWILLANLQMKVRHKLKTDHWATVAASHRSSQADHPDVDVVEILHTEGSCWLYLGRFQVNNVVRKEDHG